MDETIWSAIAKEGLVPLVMAVFCYFTYRYFTKQNDKLYTRIEQKDEVITKMYSQHIEMTQMFIQTQLNMSGEVKDAVRIIMDLESKTDRILEGVIDIKKIIKI